MEKYNLWVSISHVFASIHIVSTVKSEEHWRCKLQTDSNVNCLSHLHIYYVSKTVSLVKLFRVQRSDSSDIIHGMVDMVLV